MQASLDQVQYEKDRRIEDLTDENFEKFRRQHDQLFIFFYSPSCKHCHSAWPELQQAYDQVVTQKLGVKFAMINARDNQSTAAKYEISGFPKFYYFYEGSHLKYTGSRNAQKFIDYILRIQNSSGKIVKSLKEAAEWMDKFDWTVWLFSKVNSKLHQVFDEAIKNLSGPQYIVSP